MHVVTGHDDDVNPSAPQPQTRVRIPLPDDATAPMVARRTLRNLLGGWRLPGLVEPVVLAVSELVTNAFRHGSPPVRLTVRRSPGRVSVGVGDSSDALPTAGSPGREDDAGRGMSIVDLVASDTGVRTDGPGKVVWAGFDVDHDV